MINLIDESRVHRRHFLHHQIHVLESVLQSEQQQPGHAGGDGSAAASAGQLSQVHPLAAYTLQRTETDPVRERRQAADQEHVRVPEGSGVPVLLPETQEGTELRPHPRLFKHLPDRRLTWYINI